MRGRGWRAWQGVACMVGGGMCGRGHELWGVVCVAGGACVAGGSAWWGCVHGRVHAWQGGMWGRGGMHEGHVWQGGVHGGGACMVGGMHSRGGACLAGGGVRCKGSACKHAPRQIIRDTVIRSRSGRYASYWNAFLFFYRNVLSVLRDIGYAVSRL